MSTDKIEALLDKHAEYYIKETMKFFQNDGVSPAISRNNPGDLEARAAIEAIVAEARIDELEKWRTQYAGMWGYLDKRLAELTYPTSQTDSQGIADE